MTTNPPKLRNYNGWLPASRAVYDSYVNGILQRARTPYESRAAHVPAVEKFKQAIEANSTMVKLWDNIFLQVSSENKIPDFENLLYLLDVIVVGPPRFAVAQDGATQVAEPIGVPMYLLFDLLSNTSAAYDLFRMDEFNVALKDLLNSWGNYLKTSDSSKTLTDASDGWFSDASIQLLEENRGVFNDTYVIFDSTAVNRGYISWDEFFTRRIQPSARPVVPDQGKAVIYNACESTVERWLLNVQDHDQFWLKGMAYSLYDIFDGDEATAQQFVGGTVYQAFLSPQDYHRWHSPVTGTIVDARVVNGTYYAVLPDDGQDDTDQSGDPHGALIRSQPWLTVSSTRAVITIQSDNTGIGLVGFIGIGMAEVSTCELLVQQGQRVQPGQQLGMFHFGGSSHALIFGPQAKLTFEAEVQPGTHLWVNRIIAAVNQ